MSKIEVYYLNGKIIIEIMLNSDEKKTLLEKIQPIALNSGLDLWEVNALQKEEIGKYATALLEERYGKTN